MDDPRLALRLYVIILIVAVMFSSRWAAVRSYLAEARKKASEKSSGTS